MKKDIIIGTAQLATNYGIANKNYSHNITSSKKILNEAINNEFKNIDTAYSYKNAHKIIGKWKLRYKSNVKIYTKVPKLNNIPNCHIEKIIKKSFEDLNLVKLEGLLMHNPYDWRNPYMKKVIVNLFNNNKLNKFGLSIYNSEDIIDHDPLIKTIQLPGNIFNQKILLSKKINNFYNRGGEIQIRSVFNQGLLLMTPNKIPKKFEHLKKPIAYFQNIAKELNIHPSIIAIACIKYICPPAKIVVGFDNIQQLNIIKNIDKYRIDEDTIRKLIKYGLANHSSLWDPRKWK